MKLSTILKMRDVIQEIKEKFKGNAYLYYDEVEKDFSIALSDVDLYWNDNFRGYAAKILDSFESDGVTIINLPEKIIMDSISNVNDILIKSFENVFVAYKESESMQSNLESYALQTTEKISQITSIYSMISSKQNVSKTILFDQDAYDIPRSINNIEPYIMAA